MNYIFKNNLLLLLLVTVLLTSCGYRETNTQTRDIAFLKFNKSKFNSYTVVVNNQYTFKLLSCTTDEETHQCHDDTIDKLFEVSSGNIALKILDKDDHLIMDKSMYIGSSSTKEIALP